MTSVSAADPRNPTSQDLLDMCLARGFELIKTTDAHYIKKGTTKFTLPKEGYANAHTTKHLIDICSEIDRKLQGQKNVRRSLPIAVLWNGEQYAVDSQNPVQYRVQSLEDGLRKWVEKSQVEVLTMEDLKPQEPAPLAGIASNNGNGYHAEDKAVAAAAEEPFPPVEKGPEPERAPPAYMTRKPATELSVNPLGNWTSTTFRTIEALRLKIEQEEAKLEPMKAQLRELSRVYELVSGQSLSGGAPSQQLQYRRTVLPPSGPGKGHGRHVSAGTYGSYRPEAKRLWLDGLGGQEIFNRLGADKVGTAGNVYNWITKWKKGED